MDRSLEFQVTDRIEEGGSEGSESDHREKLLD
jgi:hypothetical protein